VQVDHLVHGVQQRQHRLGPRADARQRALPDARVQALDLHGVGVEHLRAEAGAGRDAVHGVVLQRGAQLGARGLVEQIRAQPRGADRVRLRDDQVLALQEARPRRGEAEGEQESQQPEHRSLHGADLSSRRVGQPPHPATRPESGLQGDQQGHQQPSSNGEILEHRVQATPPGSTLAGKMAA
jgi:hypothetical protein